MGIISYFKKRAAAKRKAEVISNTKPESSPVTYSTTTGGSTNVVKTTSGGGGGGGSSGGSSGGGSSSSGGGGEITSVELPPIKAAPVKSVDYVDSSGKRVGGKTTYGSKDRGFGAGEKGFTGKVEEIKGGGEIGETQYFYGGRELGKVETLDGKKVYRPSNEIAFTRAMFGFDVSGGKEQVSLTSEQAEISRYDYVSPTFYVGTVEKFEEPSFKEDPLYKIRKKQSEIETAFYRGESSFGTRAASFGLGIAAVGIGTYAFVKSLVTQPAQTIMNLPKGLVMEVKDIGKGLKSPTSEFALGKVTGYVALGKATEGIGKGTIKLSDIYRTTGKTEIPFEDIVAPEYLRGQTYPTIRRGQTAGELLSEFKTKEVYGVTELKGFTASPGTFKSETIITSGSSELPGLYQSPKLSPNFLKVTEGEKVLFSFNPFGTFRPTAIIARTKSYEFVRGIKAEQSQLGSLGKAKQFFGTEAEIGKSYIPFIKTEKEAVIPAGTQLKLTGSRFFFKFEGRKIPIMEFETINIGKSFPEISKGIYSFEDVSKISSRNLASKSYISSYDILRFRSGSYTSRISQSFNLNLKSYPIPSKSSNIILPSGNSFYYSSKLPFKNIYRSPKSYSRLRSPSRNYFTGTGSYGGYSSGNSLVQSSAKISTRPKIDIGMPKQNEMLKATRAFKFIPSFGAALAKDIGINLIGYGEGGKSQSGLFERQFRKNIILPTTFLKNIKKIKMKNPYSSGKGKKKNKRGFDII